MPEQNHGPIEDLYVPLSNEQLLPLSAEEQIYGIYTARINSIPGFRQRLFVDAQEDFAKTVVNANEADINYVKGIINMLITPESYQDFKNDIKTYWDRHGLETRLKTHSVVFLTNHRAFSDLPIAAATVRDVRQHDVHSASRNLMIVGKMIPGMEVDIFGNQEYLAVTPLLSMVARQVQTIPKLSKDASETMKAQRFLWNEEAKSVIEAAASAPGHILYEAASGTHDEISEDGQKLTMKSIKPETARMLCNPRLIVLPLFFSCNSFGPDGLRAAQANYQLLAPRTMHTPEDVWNTLRELAAAGKELLSDEFPRGVEYEASLKDKASRAGRFFTDILSRDDETGPY